MWMRVEQQMSPELDGLAARQVDEPSLEARQMTHALHIWAEETHIATLEHEIRDDRGRLKYAAHWAADANAYAYTTKL